MWKRWNYTDMSIMVEGNPREATQELFWWICVYTAFPIWERGEVDKRYEARLLEEINLN